MTQRPRLTANEIDAILSVAGAADAPAVFEDDEGGDKDNKRLNAFERGMEKLRIMLAEKQKGKP